MNEKNEIEKVKEKSIYEKIFEIVLITEFFGVIISLFLLILSKVEFPPETFGYIARYTWILEEILKSMVDNLINPDTYVLTIVWGFIIFLTLGIRVMIEALLQEDSV